MEIAGHSIGEGVQVPYVKDGLSFWIDAIWNYGVGRHEDNVMPYDLTGHGKYESGSCELGKDSILVKAWQDPLIYRCDNVMRIFPTDTGGRGTLEVVFEATLGYESDRFQGDVSLGRGIAHEENAASFHTQAHYFQAYKNSSGLRRSQTTLVSGTHKYQSSTFFDGEYVASMHINGQAQSLQPPMQLFNRPISPFIAIGGYRSIIDRKFFCVRLYDRQLTEEETVSNWLVDKERFNI